MIIGDFEILASSLNLKYIAIHKDKILDEAGWRSLGNVRGEDTQVCLFLFFSLLLPFSILHVCLSAFFKHHIASLPDSHLIQ